MARYRRSIAGEIVGSLFDTTFANWRGIKVAKHKMQDYTDANTLPQQKNRKRFAILSDLSKKLQAASRIGFRALAVKKTEHNVFVSKNKEAVLVDDNLAQTVSYNQLQVSSGPLPTSNGSLTATRTGADITLNWSSGNDETAQTNVLKTIYLCKNEEVAITGEIDPTRNVETMTETLPFVPTGPVWVYVFFFDPTTKQVSNSEAVVVN